MSIRDKDQPAQARRQAGCWACLHFAQLVPVVKGDASRVLKEAVASLQSLAGLQKGSVSSRAGLTWSRHLGFALQVRSADLYPAHLCYNSSRATGLGFQAVQRTWFIEEKAGTSRARLR